MKASFLVLLPLFVAIALARPLNPKNSLWAVNCGSTNSKRATVGIVLDADKDYDEKTVSVDYMQDQNYRDELIRYTNDPEIYKTERHAYNTFHYYIPISKLKTGKHVLILKFCEMYFQKPGNRVFNVRLGNEIVIKNLDIVAKAGRFTAHDEYVEFDYKKEDIIFKGKSIGSSAIRDGKLVVEFEKTDKDNPIVNGLILYYGSIAETDFLEQQMYKEQWEKNHKEELRKSYLEKQKKDAAKMKRREKIKIRNDHLDDLDEDFEEVEQAQRQDKQREIPPFRELLMTPFGAVAMIGFFVSTFVLIAFTFFDPYGQKKLQENQKKLPVQQFGYTPVQKSD